jgi:hypothetical protein
MGGGGGGGRHGVQGRYFARLRARYLVLEATEADLRARGLPVPAVPMLWVKIVGIGLLSVLLCALLVGVTYWWNK